jgi:hypothetical protein
MRINGADQENGGDSPVGEENFGFAIEAVVGDDTVRRFLKSVDPVLGADWIARHVKPM